MEALESNLKMSGNVISRMQKTAEKLNFEQQDDNGRGAEDKMTISRPMVTKKGTKNAVDNGCNFSRTPSGTSADVKVSMAVGLWLLICAFLSTVKV